MERRETVPLASSLNLLVLYVAAALAVGSTMWRNNHKVGSCSSINMLYPQDHRHIKHRLRELGFQNLWQFWKSDHWKATRVLWNRKKAECFCCGTKKGEIHLHHHTYRRLGFERDDDMCWLCDHCHTQVHLLYKTMTGRWKRHWLRTACYQWRDMINPGAPGVPPLARVPETRKKADPSKWAKPQGPRRAKFSLRRLKRERDIRDLNQGAKFPVKSYRLGPPPEKTLWEEIDT